MPLMLEAAKPAIVINTSPSLALIAALGDLTLIGSLYQRVVVPHAVQAEVLAAGKEGFGVAAFMQADFFERQQVAVELAPLLRASLDRGEAEVIATAQALDIGLVCIDEVQGRRIARLSGLQVTGSLGILLKLKALGSLQAIRPCIVRMRSQGIWLSSELENQALFLAGEADS
jgi:predicted nucleic acid-binding protein